MSRRGNNVSGLEAIITFIVVAFLLVIGLFPSSEENKINNTSNHYTYNSSGESSKNTYYSDTTRQNYTTYNNYEDEDSQTVYITDTGSKYHRSGCQYLRSSHHAISKSNAISRGYGACSRCRP